MDKFSIAIYSRKSKYIEGSESIDNQIEMCKDYIQRNFKNTDNIFIYEDEGFSGGNIDRPNFSKLMEDAKHKMFNVLICYRLDRISRNIADFTKIITELQDLNIDFISIKEQFDTSSPMGRAMMYISSVFAQLERETIAERIKDNLLELAKEGRWLGGKEPLGYKKVGIGKDAILEIDTKYKNIVKEMFDKYIEYNSLAQVHKWTIREGLKTKEDNYFNVNSVRRILVNPVYCVADEEFYKYAKQHNMKICNSLEEFKSNKKYGVMCYNKQKENAKKVEFRNKDEWIVAIGKHEALIASDLWITVQNRIEENADKAPREGQAQDALLAGLLRCKSCGGTFRVIANYRNNKRLQHYYKCRTKAKSNTLLCNVKNINGAEADKMVLDYLKRLGTDKFLIKNLFGEHETDLKNNNIAEELEKLETLIIKNKKDIEKLTERLIEAENSVASKYIVQKIEKLDSDIKDLNKKITELNSKQNANKLQEINLKIFQDSVNYLLANIDNLDIEQRKRAVRNVVKTVYWDGENLEVEPRI